MSSFYMDKAEITNRQYRQFVNWVRDSIVRTALAERAGTPTPTDNPMRKAKCPAPTANTYPSAQVAETTSDVWESN